MSGPRASRLRYLLLVAPVTAGLLTPGDPAAAAVTVSVATYGAVPGDVGDDTDGFARALSAASAAGGGTVRAAAGTYRVQPDRLTLDAKVVLAGSGTVLTAAGDGSTLLTVGDGAAVSGVTVEGEDRVVRGIAVSPGARNVRLTSVTVRNVASPREPGVAGYAANAAATPAGVTVGAGADGVTLDKVTVDGVHAAALADPQATVTGDFEGRYPMWPTWRRETAADAYQPGTDYPYSWQLVNAPVRSGVTAYRSELRRTDPKVAGSTRSEATRPAEPAREENWYGFSILLPQGGTEDWATDTSAEVVAQWHNSPDPEEKDATISPPLALLTKNGGWELHRWWDERPVTDNSLMWNSGRHEETLLGSYEADKGAWTDWAFHVRWGWLPEHAPLLEVYKNRTLVYRSTGPNTTNDAVGNYFKMGIYKWDWWQGKPSLTSRRVIYHDEFRVDDAGGSLDTVSPPNARLAGEAGHPAARGIAIGEPGQPAPRNVTVKSSTVRDVGPRDDAVCLLAQGEAEADTVLRVQTNAFSGCAGTAVRIGVPGATVASNKIDNPFLGGNPSVVRSPAGDTADMDAGISVQASRVTVTGNTLGGVGSYRAGIEVAGAGLDQVAVTRNTIVNGAAARTGAAEGIRLRTAPAALTLQGNSVRNAAVGVRCDAEPSAAVYAVHPMTAVATPYTGCVRSPAVDSPESLNPAGGDPLTITGEGFGTSPLTFRAAGITATINGRTVRLTWVDDGTLRGLTPRGTAGAQAALVLSRSGVGAAPVTLPGRYAATFTSAVPALVPVATGATWNARGAGFATATAWQLTGPVTVDLPRVADKAAFAAARAGVLVLGDGSATVKLPPAPDVDGDGRRDPGAYTLQLTPAEGVPYLPAARTSLTYR